MASVIDETGNEHTGTEVGSPTYSAGAIGAAISLDGVADHLTTPDATDLNLTAFTYMAWIKTSNVAAMPIYSNWSSINPVRQGSIFKINTTGEIRGVVAGGGWGGEGEADGYAHVIGSNNLCDGKWHHVAFTYDGLVLRVFERGYEVASRDYVKTIPYGSECAAAVGCQYNDGVTPAQYFTGDIDDARIYRKALSEAEIQEIIAGVILSFEDSVLQALPAWYWQLDETSGIIAEEKKLGVDNLEYESDASTNSYAVTASQNDGRGTAKSLSGNAPPTDMLAHWQMNNEGGGQATIIDSTANGYDVPTGGSPTVGGVAGVINEATYLNGAQVGVLTSHVPFDVTNITIGAWVKTTDTGIQCIYSNYSNDLNAVSGVDFRIKSNVISLVIGSNTGMLLGTNYDLADGTTTVTDGNWHYVVGTYDGLYIKIYTDGVLEATEPYSGGLFYDLPNARMNIACRTDDFYFNRVNYLTGTLDEVVFFDRAITASEVFNLYNEPSTTTPTSLQIYDPTLTQFPEDWNVDLFTYPFGWTYNFGYGISKQIYERYDQIWSWGEETWGDRWRTINEDTGVGGDGRADTSNVASRVVRRGTAGGKYVVRWDYIDDVGFNNGLSLTFKMGGNDQMFLGTMAADSGTAITIRGSFEVFKQSNSQGDLGTLGNGSSCYVFIDYDNGQFHVSKGGAILGTYTFTSMGWMSVMCGRTGDRASSVRLDPDPDISGVSALPAGTVEADWVGWNNKADFDSRYNIHYIPNDASSWVGINGGSVSNETSPTGVSVKVTGGTATLGNCYSQPYVVPVSGEYIMVVELDDTSLPSRTDEVKKIFGYINDVQQSFNSTIDVGSDDAYDSSKDNGVMTTRFVASAGDTLRVGVGRAHDAATTFRNAYIVGVK